jgi:hypothetical protein
MDEQRLAEIAAHALDARHRLTRPEPISRLTYEMYFVDYPEHALELVAEVRRLRALAREYAALIESDYPLSGHYGEQYRQAKAALGETP